MASTIVTARYATPVIASDAERDFISGAVWIINDVDRMRRVFAIALATALLTAGVGVAAAQDAGSRAEEEARRQQEKARSFSPYKPRFIERQILTMERVGGFGVPHGLFVTFGDIKHGSGIALGPAYGRVLPSGTTVVAKGAYSVNSYKMAQFSMQSAPAFGDRLVVSGRIRWQDAPGVRLYALGPDSTKARTDYSETKNEVSGRALFKPARLLRFGGGVSFERYTTGQARTIDPQLLVVPGMGADPSYLHTHGSAAIDSRDGEGYSRHGTLLQATLHDYRQRDNGVLSFQRVDGALEQYLPVLHGNWVIFLGLHASTTSADDGHAVPFFLLPDLGGHDLRGFALYRFRDRHSIYMTAEYRWYAQEFLDAAIFYDGGKVVPDRRALDFTHFKHSVGAGIRLHGLRTTAMRFEIARSNEGKRILVAFSPVGQ